MECAHVDRVTIEFYSLVTIAYVRKSFFAATNCNKIVFSSTEIVTKSLFFTLISQD